MSDNYYESVDFVCNNIAMNELIQYELFDFLMGICYHIGYIVNC